MKSFSVVPRKMLPVMDKLSFIKPTWLSYSALILTIGAAGCYISGFSSPGMLLGAVFLLLVRLLLNILEEALVYHRGQLSMKEQMVIIVPDIFGDAVLMLGIGLSGFCRPIYVLLGLITIFMIEIAGILGKTIGVELQRQGPLGKKAGLILVLIFTLIQYFQPEAIFFGRRLMILEWLLVVIFGIGQITVLNRLRGTFRQIFKLEWLNGEKYAEINAKILVVYDSQTGNTEKIAEEISHCLNSGVRKIEETVDLKVRDFDLVIIGSPNVNSAPSLKVRDFLKEHPDLRNYAVFITYGVPLWGWLSTRLCYSYFKKALKRKPLAVFSCKAYNPRFGLYRGRPNENDLLKGFLFGAEIAKLLKKCFKKATKS